MYTTSPRGSVIHHLSLPIFKTIFEGFCWPAVPDNVVLLSYQPARVNNGDCVQMVREGIRPRDFLCQFDKQQELVIPRADFYRGLAASGVSLTPVEMDTLMEVFMAPGRRRFVEYERFCSTVGDVRTQRDLERAPLLTPVPHVPPAARPAAPALSFQERNVVSGALNKLAKYPDQLSNILEVFKDMDRSRCGSIPRVSVERALCQRNLLHLMSSRERDLLYKCFGYRRGCDDESTLAASEARTSEKALEEIKCCGTGLSYGYPPRGPSADWRVLTTADAARTNGSTCLPKHEGTRDRRFSVIHPMTDHCESCFTPTIAAERAYHPQDLVALI
ncbi:hypothetical protein evm_015015 [Chilo suppressalis]|nr:hypothetical protein evm_015015 [Chilo suppressalis]